MLMALLRCAGGHVSLISTAPDAHSPPMPMPSSARHSSSCITLCDVAAPSDATEKRRIVAISARVRPRRSATIAEQHAADARHHQRDRPEHARSRVVEAEIGPQLPDRHRVEHEVHRIEHPP